MRSTFCSEYITTRDVYRYIVFTFVIVPGIRCIVRTRRSYRHSVENVKSVRGARDKLQEARGQVEGTNNRSEWLRLLLLFQRR